MGRKRRIEKMKRVNKMDLRGDGDSKEVYDCVLRRIKKDEAFCFSPTQPSL